MTNNIFRSVIFLLAVIAGLHLFSMEYEVLAQGAKSRGWRVWIRRDPCAGRFDWLSVARDIQGGGKNIYVPYETLLGNQGCTQSGPRGCTFDEATALMESLRGNDKFLDLCCRDYSVWENSETGKRSVVVGKMGTAGFGWQIVKGDLCCEEAEALSGIPNSCGHKGGGKTGGAGAFAGKWAITTRFGDMSVSLTQAGSRVTGTFANAFASGSLDGTITGSTFNFKWRSGSDTGSGEATLATDGTSFSGFWVDDETKTRVAMTGTKSP